MRVIMAVAAAIALSGPAAAGDVYKLEPGIDRVAQLAELLKLYADLCLTAFPEDGALFRRVIGLKGTKPVTGAELDDIFHGEAGLAWTYKGRSSRFVIAIEMPPVHSCTVRTTMIGFGEDAQYRAIADPYETKASGFHERDVIDQVTDGIRRVVAGDEKRGPDGNSDALMMLVATPATEALRAGGNTGVDVRLVHLVGQAPSNWLTR